MLDLKSATEQLLADYSLINSAKFAEYPAKLIAALNAGEIRSAEKAPDGNWKSQYLGQARHSFVV